MRNKDLGDRYHRELYIEMSFCCLKDSIEHQLIIIVVH